MTVFPPGITVGATFDKKLMYERAVAIGKEARGKGVHVWLGPTVGPIGRKPKGGRNWEGFGADPCLQAAGARETVKGVQEQGVIATIKHFIGNEQEMYRMYNPVQSAYSSDIGTLESFLSWLRRQELMTKQMIGFCTSCICGRSPKVFGLAWDLS